MNHYYTGKLCSEGHSAVRLVGNGACQTCNQARNREWNLENRDYELARKAIYNAANRDRLNEMTRENHRVKRSENQARVIKRRAAKRGATPVWYGEMDRFVMAEADDLARRREAVTGIKWQVDHMIPLQSRTACGLHCAANLQVIPAWMNARKLNRMILTEPGEWLRTHSELTS